MLCRIYGDDKGDLILVPECMQASQLAEHTYGPLRDRGTLRTRMLPNDLRKSVQRDFDEKSFSVVAADIAKKLGLGSDSTH